MDYKIIASENFKSVRWSGGNTTELFIYPSSAEYQKRNFQFRLSTSTIETDKSDFTRLNGFSRILMVLSGNIILSHENHYSKSLSEFDVDEFEGEWNTTSSGKCTDFNLMTTGDLKGKLTPLILEKNQIVSDKLIKICDWLFIYLYKGNVSLEISEKSIELNAGDLLILENIAGQIFEIKGIEYSELVIAKIFKNH